MKKKMTVSLTFLMTIMLLMLGVTACSPKSKNNLKSKITEVENAKPGLEESGLWDESDESVLKTSKEIAQDKNADEDLITYAISELDVILTKVQLGSEQVDKKELNSKIAEVSALDEAKYTEKSFDNLESVLILAEEILKDNKATQVNVKLMAEALENAINELELIKESDNVIDKTALASQIEKASAVENTDNKGDSWIYFEDILQVAKDINADSNSSQEEIDAVTEELKKAQQDLDNAKD